MASPRILNAMLLFEKILGEKGSEALESRMIARYSLTGYVVLEVGARTGIFTALLSELVGASGLVLAIEPNPFAFDALVDRMKNLKNVRTENLALSSLSGTETLSISSKNLYDPGARVGRKGGSEVPVRAERADKLLSSIGIRPRVLVIDAKGSEYSILLGMGRLLLDVELVFIEIHEFLDSSMRSKVDELLKTYNFSVSDTEIESKSPRITSFIYKKIFAARNI